MKCMHCVAREAALALFEEHCVDGGVGRFIDGLLSAAAGIAVVHVLPGLEAAERDSMTSATGDYFDQALVIVRAQEGSEATKQ